MATMSLFGGATVTKDSIYDYKVKVSYRFGAGPVTSSFHFISLSAVPAVSKSNPVDNSHSRWPVVNKAYFKRPVMK